MNSFPVQIKLNADKYLYLKWNDDSESQIELSHLRRLCPCAICVSEQEPHNHDYIKIYSKDQLTIKSIKAAGNYAIAIDWADGHNTGFYDFDYLKKISCL